MPQRPSGAMPPAAHVVLPHQDPASNPDPQAQFLVTHSQDDHLIDWNKVMYYVVFDLETTGTRKQQDEIIKVAAVILDKTGAPLEDAKFNKFVKPSRPISPFITGLTTITNELVRDADRFLDVGSELVRFMQEAANKIDTYTVDHIVLVGHNCLVFDIPIGNWGEEKESRQDLLWYPRRARDATVGEQRRGKRDVYYFDVSGYFGWLRIGSHTGFVCVVGVSVYTPGL